VRSTVVSGSLSGTVDPVSGIDEPGTVEPGTVLTEPPAGVLVGGALVGGVLAGGVGVVGGAGTERARS
jgi:hypothetical protein